MLISAFGYICLRLLMVTEISIRYMLLHDAASIVHENKYAMHMISVSIRLPIPVVMPNEVSHSR